MTWSLRPLDWADLPGWRDDGLATALAMFRRGAVRLLQAPDLRQLHIPLPLAAARASLELGEDYDNEAARRFFERHFRPLHIDVPQGRGFVTGYFEPEVDASAIRTKDFPAPLYRRPSGLEEIPADFDRSSLGDEVAWAIFDENGKAAPAPDRAAVGAGACDGLELAFLSNAVEAFFIQIQGSARLRMTDGTIRRVGFDGKSGHPYTPVGRELIRRGEIRAGDMTAERLKAWLLAHPEQAEGLMNSNRSFVFFRWMDISPGLGPLGAAGLPLTAGRSLAVDRNLFSFHHPVWLEANLPSPDGKTLTLRRLMIAEDTGSAIVGPARGDIFFGSGAEAWRQASLVRHEADFTILVDREAAFP